MTFNIEEAKRLYRSGIIVSRKKMGEGDFLTFAYFTFLRCLPQADSEKGKFRDYYCKALRQNVRRWISKDSELDNHRYIVSQGCRKFGKTGTSVPTDGLLQPQTKALKEDAFNLACNFACCIMNISARDWEIWRLSHDKWQSEGLAQKYGISLSRLSHLRVRVRAKLLAFFQERGIELEDFYA